MADKIMGLREKKKKAQRKLLAETTIELFLEHGFHGTTVDRIADVAGISRRTFFHYFPAKQDVLTAWYGQQGEYLATVFRARPTDEPIWDSLVVAFLKMHKHYGGDDERTRRLRRLIHLEPVLLAKKYDFYVGAAEMLVPAVKSRIRTPVKQNLMVHVVVQAAIAAYNAAYGEWTLRSSSQFEAIALRSFRLGRPVSTEDFLLADVKHRDSEMPR